MVSQVSARHGGEGMNGVSSGKAWQPCQVLVDQELEEWLQLEIGFTCSDLLPSVRPRLPKAPQPRTVTASSSQKGFIETDRSWQPLPF